MFQVYELPVDLFHRSAALFAQTWFDEMYIDPVLKGQQPGRIFVDRSDTPAAAIMFRTFEFYVAGDANTASLRTFIKDAPTEPGTFQHFHGYAPIGKAWESALLADHPGQLNLLLRCNFRWANAPIMNWRAQLPAGAAVVPITVNLAQRIDREWNETIGQFWSGYDRYEQQGYGFCLMIGQELGSMASADGADGHSVNMGVRTAVQFRKQGLAKLVCSAFIEHTLGRGLLPTWDCEERNTASKALAQGLGFVEGEPFCQLSAANYGPLTLSKGRWYAVPGDQGITIWSKRQD